MIIEVNPSWTKTAQDATALPIYADVFRPDRLVPGFVAELAVMHLLEIQGRREPVQWLATCTALLSYPADIRWGDVNLEVKLLMKGQGQIQIKKNAESLPHICLEWEKFTESLRIVGILLPYAPETFSPPKRLKNALTNEAFTQLHNHHKAVIGWEVPRSRLVPPEMLFTLV